jgi:MGT family glycosyltransferase
MKVVISIIPGKGHLVTIAPLARALQEAGNAVLFVTGASFCHHVEALGFRTAPVGFDWLKVSQANLAVGDNPLHSQRELTKEPDLLQNINTYQSLADPQENTDLAQTPLLEDSVGAQVNLPVVSALEMDNILPALLDVIREWQPDVILRDALDFAPYVAGDVLDIPHAVFSSWVIWPKAWLQYMVGKYIRQTRERYGVAPDPELERLDHYLSLSFTPSGYQSTSGDITTLHFISPQIVEDTIGSVQLPAWVDSLPSQPTIYISLGTMFTQTKETYLTILRALREEPLNLIVALGGTLDPAVFGPQPANVHIERYIPMSLIASRCDVIVSHAGANTVMTTLSHGLPMLLIPIGADQPLHALRCTELGVALRLDAEDLHTEDVRSSLYKLLEETSYRQMSQRLQQEIMTMPGLEYATELLTQLARERQPIRGQIIH